MQVRKFKDVQAFSYGAVSDWKNQLYCNDKSRQ